MKLSHYVISLFSLFFVISISHAEINIKKCKVTKEEALIFDEYDSQIAEKIIDYKLHNQPEKRENSIIKIFTNENSEDRNYWLASIQTDDKSEFYLFYQVDKNEIIEVDQKQFEALLPKIVECNQTKQLPIYSENFDED
ncbi:MULTISPECIES: hypothetical protein [unclassified Gilliamella]|uniref:hypothetical protein n=1 Tax=unclassified Gilliamella TaxID=2685620 RepID=UPI00226A5A78|nr:MULTISPECIES: hypothetical protein [unclassified Gilliamella]MCX8580670.1 hypothetical protein [Gilliamella sp. B3482]MCX8597726.1 hypothetical protein [Gilliamella sp. B3493]MCX8599873.1 hypothetical protein [Gilliamella sp. B3486]MCX8690209.1 hypothetical protein [Gilliamella sp. B2973]MCX8705862.1 hypothetical protein [Gilliamella sp. B3127]